MFKSHNYKVCVSIGASAAVLYPLRAVLDTGAGINLVREDVLPAGWEKMLLPNVVLPRITNASGRRMAARGVIILHLQVGDLLKRVRFYVTPGLGVPCILGCAFINLYVRSIHPKERRVDLNEGGSVAISSGLSACQVISSEREFTPSTKVRMAHRTVVPARCEAHIEVTTAVAGLVVLTQSSKTIAVTLASGVAEVRSNIPFRVRVLNPSNRSYTLSKGMVIGIASPHPERIISVGMVQELTSNADEAGGSCRETAGLASTWKQDVNLDHLAPEEREAVLRMLEPHHKMWDGHLGTVAATSHRIEVIPKSKPVHCQPYRAGARARGAEKEEIDRMLAENVIEPTTCEWASPIVLVPKPDGSLRFCVDYRRLNAITVPDTYPLPRMDECIDSLGDAVVFTTLDCNSGYWQIPVHPKDRDKTTFTSHYGIYRFLRLPFGLRNAPATFQRAIDIILSGVKWKTCLVYLDDVIVFSSSRQAHLAHVAEALTLLGNAGLSLKLSKCHFFSETVDYLGHVIRPGRLGVAEKNTTALRTAPLPRTQTELRSFLGLCNVYRRFVPRFSALAAPLNALLCKGMPPQLGPISEGGIAAFNALRDRLLSPPVFALPRAEGKIWLDTDASDGQLGCCLLQLQPDGKSLPLGYWSRTLNSAERNYSTTEKECLAIVWAITHLRPYLEGVNFTVRTDHHALRWVMNLSDAQGRLARWRLRLAEFTFKVEYHPGAAHHAADALSRLPHQAVPFNPIDEEIPVCSVLSHALDAEVTRDHPCALEENSPSPIEEIPIVTVSEMFDHQCLDATAKRICERMATDPSWDHDRNGLLVQRLSSGETSLHVPSSLQRPCAVTQDLREVSFSTDIAAHPISSAADGLVLNRGVRSEVLKNSFATETLTSPDNPVIRILTRAPLPRRNTTSVGLALITVPDEVSTIPTGTETGAAAIAMSEFRVAQAADQDCQRFLSLSTRAGLFDLNEEGVLIRIAPSDGSRQIVVPRVLVSRILFTEHYPPAVGHPGAHRMFRTIRRSFFWPRMVEDVYETVRQCDLCARNRMSEKRRTNPLKLFPARGPLESVAMDILGPLPRTKHGNLFLLVIADRFSKVTKTVPLRTVTALSVARAFCDHWAYVYGPPVSLLTDNGPQFTAKFFQAVCAELGIHKVFTTAYHPQTNGQVERYNRTILASLRGYVAVRQDDWDDYTSAVTFAYNCRVHASLGMPPFELALTRPPPSLSLQSQPTLEERTPSTLKREFLERLKTLRFRAGMNLHHAQTRYKKNFDRGVVQKNANLEEGDDAYVRVEVTDVGRNHKLESLVQGPYRVVENAGNTFRLRIGEETVRVSSDRVTPAPSRVNDPVGDKTSERIITTAPRQEVEPEEPESPPDLTSPDGILTPPTEGPPPGGLTPGKEKPPRVKRRVRFTLPEATPVPPRDKAPSNNASAQEYVVDKIVDAVDGFGDGSLVYRVRWLGYDPSEDTWEPEEHLPAHFIRRYWKAQKVATPHGRSRN